MVENPGKWRETLANQWDDPPHLDNRVIGNFIDFFRNFLLQT